MPGAEYPQHRWFESLPGILGDLGVGLAVGNDEHMVYVNEAFCSLTGYSADELLAMRTMGEVLAPDVRGPILAGAGPRVAGEAAPRYFETELVHRDGHRVPVEVGADVLDIEGRAEIVGTFRDLTWRMLGEAELAIRARQQAVVAELGRQALLNPDVSALVDVAVEAVARTLDVEYVEMLELLPGGESLLLRAGVGWRDGCVGRATVGTGRHSQAGHTLAADAPVVAEDLSRESRFGIPPLLADHGVRSSMTVIIRGESGPFGILGADASRRRLFSEDDVHFLRAVANVLADAVARAHIEAELATRVRQQAAVVELGRQALVDPDVSALVDVAVDLVARTLDVEHVEVLQLVGDTRELLLRAGVGWRDGCVGRATVRAGLDSQAGYTLASDAPIVVEDLSRETRFRPPALLGDHGVVSGMTVIVGAGRPWGVLGAHTKERRVFGPDDIGFLQAVAHVLAVAIERGEVDEALQATHDQERRLRQRLEAYAAQAVKTQEAERRHIARELHDEVGQLLTGLMFTLQKAEHLPVEALSNRLDGARTLVGELLHQVRALSLDLRPAVLDDLGLGSALLALVERFTAQTGLEVAVSHAGLDDRLAPDIEIAAYRIAQEALTNVARHAGVGHATLKCVLGQEALIIEITDQGVGFDLDAPGAAAGSGLLGMEERARANGGRLRVVSHCGAGTRVVAELAVGERRVAQP